MDGPSPPELATPLASSTQAPKPPLRESDEDAFRRFRANDLALAQHCLRIALPLIAVGIVATAVAVAWHSEGAPYDHTPCPVKSCLGPAGLLLTAGVVSLVFGLAALIGFFGMRRQSRRWVVGRPPPGDRVFYPSD